MVPKGTRDGVAMFSEVETTRIEVQPRTPPRPAPTLIDNQHRAGDIQDHSQQDRPEIALSAPDASANRTHKNPLRALPWEPGT